MAKKNKALQNRHAAGEDEAHEVFFVNKKKNRDATAVSDLADGALVICETAQVRQRSCCCPLVRACSAV